MALVELCVGLVRERVPDAVAVFVGGSVVRGDAGPCSDESWQRDGLEHPAGPPEPAHFVSDLAKVVNAGVAGDDPAVLLAAQDGAVGAGTAAAVEPGRAGRRAALRGFAVVPDGYADDMPVCLGLSGSSTSEVHAAAIRVGRGVAELLYAQRVACAAVIPVAEIDGLRRYVSGMR